MDLPTSEKLLRLMYSSVSAPQLNAAALDTIYQAAQQHNQAHRITGLWLVNQRLNIHYLEGPAQTLRALWARIQADPRHHSVVQLLEQELTAPRLFPTCALLRGKASRQEMLAMVRSAYLRVDAVPKPEWAQGIGPLMILLDGEFEHAYSQMGED
jgi:hypothetical protein